MNMGFTDRALRIALAAVIGVLYFANVISGTLAIVLLFFAAIFVLTSFVGFCPLYLPFGISTKQDQNSKIDFPGLLMQGAQVIDVRTKGEYNSGHFAGSINIPLHEIRNHLGEIDMKKPVVVCCASGVRSQSAVDILKFHGFNVVNGGSWSSLKS